ncbi:MAG: GntR family transcriptional regulator [Planctomycetes bacterium]|nr:GntR family transcriptional regulator [Planctomycetota bacterium]
MLLRIETGSHVPIYRQIVEQVRSAVASGRIGPDDKLPGVRELAIEHAVNLQTVAKAYNELVREGTLEVRRGMGTFVARKSSKGAGEAARAALEEHAKKLVRDARALGMTRKELADVVGELWKDEG